ncbi:TetR/AcrR family transcriptional regulator [Streptomyces smaragdinus]|uniref:TetR/AcrR family transcriptional regulator n=1 Tax=Streptomyces smaragdinus TaxID=2585196 RepID=UPI002B21C855|nr:TetR/AcrR family transcriptional regulator [Streptomyces smaragdinus]
MPDAPAELGPRALQIVGAARELLEEEGADALTMRRLADRLGIKAPSLYKHFADKAALEARLITLFFTELAAALEAAPDFPGLAVAYRAYAMAHPHLYTLSTDRPLPRESLPPGLEERAAWPLVRVLDGDEIRARAAWAFAHGMVVLEIAGRFPPGADLDTTWRVGAAAFLR